MKCIPNVRRIGVTTRYVNYVITCLARKKSVLCVSSTKCNMNEYFNKTFYPVLKNFSKKIWSYDSKRQTLTFMDTVCRFVSDKNPERLEGLKYSEYHAVFINEEREEQDDE